MFQDGDDGEGKELPYCTFENSVWSKADFLKLKTHINLLRATSPTTTLSTCIALQTWQNISIPWGLKQFVALTNLFVLFRSLLSMVVASVSRRLEGRSQYPIKSGKWVQRTCKQSHIIISLITGFVLMLYAY